MAEDDINCVDEALVDPEFVPWIMRKLLQHPTYQQDLINRVKTRIESDGKEGTETKPQKLNWTEIKSFDSVPELPQRQSMWENTFQPDNHEKYAKWTKLRPVQPVADVKIDIGNSERSQMRKVLETVQIMTPRRYKEIKHEYQLKSLRMTLKDLSCAIHSVLKAVDVGIKNLIPDRITDSPRRIDPDIAQFYSVQMQITRLASSETPPHGEKSPNDAASASRAIHRLCKRLTQRFSGENDAKSMTQLENLVTIFRNMTLQFLRFVEQQWSDEVILQLKDCMDAFMLFDSKVAHPIHQVAFMAVERRKKLEKDITAKDAYLSPTRSPVQSKLKILRPDFNPKGFLLPLPLREKRRILSEKIQSPKREPDNRPRPWRAPPPQMKRNIVKSKSEASVQTETDIPTVSRLIQVETPSKPEDWQRFEAEIYADRVRDQVMDEVLSDVCRDLESACDGIINQLATQELLLTHS